MANGCLSADVFSTPKLYVSCVYKMVFVIQRNSNLYSGWKQAQLWKSKKTLIKSDG